MGEPADAAETWTVATLNLVAFSLIGIVAGHASGVLADALPGLRTSIGIAVFGYLWMLVVAATWWVFAEGGLARTDEGATGRLVARGAVGGALVGMGFVGGIAVGIAVNNLLLGMVDVTSFALLLLFGLVGGGIVGGPVGLVLGLVDVGLYRASGVVLPRGSVDAGCGRPTDAGDEQHGGT